jgi:lipopolysaccharide transport system ATP-binding protein
MSGHLCVENLGKAYRRYASEWQRVLSWCRAGFAPEEEKWVLRNLTFSVVPGEAVGIIGQNGAGKSTLLKLITGTARPTEGRIHISGRIAAMLELGMGFNPELTGRQNAYHAAGLMGHSLADIERVMPEIEAFAEIGEYFDQPVRIYSSGMQARLAFSVATAFRPDLLIVDEVLSVGDSYFQHKSFGKIRQFKDEGTSVHSNTSSEASQLTRTVAEG